MAGIRSNCIRLGLNLFTNVINQNRSVPVTNLSTFRHFINPVTTYRVPPTNYFKAYSTTGQRATGSAFSGPKTGATAGFTGATTAGSSNSEEEDKEEKTRREASWRTMKISLIAIGSSLGLLSGYLVFSLGAPEKDEEGKMIEDQFSDMPVVIQYFKRMFSQLDYYNKMIKQPSRDKLLPDPVKFPYLQPPYTLVLELTDLLVHPEWTYSTGWRFKKRPGVDNFLEQVGPPLFEIVIFTAEQGMTAYPLLDSLDPRGYISYRLFRDATDFVDGQHVKNLDCLNRDLKKVIVVDWNPASVKKHPSNCLVIPRWKGRDDDATLLDLAAFLRTISTNQVEDVRDVLHYYSQFDNPIEAFRENQRKLLEQLEQQEEKTKTKPLVSRWSSYFGQKKV